MIRDLATAHQPVGDLVSIPRSAAEWERYRLSEEQVRFFHENGYLSGVRILDDRQVAAIASETSCRCSIRNIPANRCSTSITRTNRPTPTRCCSTLSARGGSRPGCTTCFGRRPSRWRPASFWAGRSGSGTTSFFASRRITGASSPGTRIIPIGREPSRCSTSRAGSAWTRRPATTAASVTFPAATAGTCCRSPGWPATCRRSTQSSPKSSGGNSKPVFAELKPGEAVFHHPLMIHGSYENRTDRPRRATVINAFRDGTRSDSDEPLLEGVPPVPKGERMGGTFFPLLFDPAKAVI